MFISIKNIIVLCKYRFYKDYIYNNYMSEEQVRIKNTDENSNDYINLYIMIILKILNIIVIMIITKLKI